MPGPKQPDSKTAHAQQRALQSGSIGFLFHRHHRANEPGDVLAQRGFGRAERSACTLQRQRSYDLASIHERHAAYAAAPLSQQRDIRLRYLRLGFALPW